ncbi:mycothiol synthase [Pseudactinotalea suaedae]|uniref:mycothiol synthase n=1 Tax=Pseudactinotalea suaedae TaxID=1524924 RepID=UPI0012E2CF8A|nr:mycothiol synthase [Pseudactinotalea suaedae]
MVAQVDADAVRALAAAVEEADGVAAFSEQTLLNLAGAPDREVHHLPVLDDGGALLGYAQLDGTSAELAVHPGHRRHGLGARLLDEVLALAPAAQVWAHGPHPGAAPLATGRGLAVVRELWLMRSPPPTAAVAPTIPSDVVVTTFDADRDAEDWLAVNARAFASHPEQGRIGRADLDARLAEPWFDARGFWVARSAVDGALLGSMWTKVSERTGEIYVLGIDPAAQGRGLGGLLTAVAMQRFAELGQHEVDEIELYVEGDNAPAIRTYQKAGFHRRRADVQYART